MSTKEIATETQDNAETIEMGESTYVYLPDTDEVFNQSEYMAKIRSAPAGTHESIWGILEEDPWL